MYVCMYCKICMESNLGLSITNSIGNRTSSVSIFVLEYVYMLKYVCVCMYVCMYVGINARVDVRGGTCSSTGMTLRTSR